MRIWLVGLGLAVAAVAALAVAVRAAVRMPDRTHAGPPPPLDAGERASRERLRRHVRILAAGIGERNDLHPDGLERAARYVTAAFEEAGYVAERQPFTFRGRSFANIEAVLPGAAGTDRSVVVGAHYDSVAGSPGANDNATGVAALLEIARALRGRALPRSVRFAAFANEEPPFFNTGEGMGSREYLRRPDAGRGRIAAMMSLETLGFYSDAEGSQRYPPLVGLLYPRRGDFLAFVGDFRSRRVVRAAVGAFRARATLPSEGLAGPRLLGVLGWSDHRSFWEAGIPAFMVTDTALFRDPEYHLRSDTPERLDYDRMARAVTGLADTVTALASAEGGS